MVWEFLLLYTKKQNLSYMDSFRLDVMFMSRGKK